MTSGYMDGASWNPDIGHPDLLIPKPYTIEQLIGGIESLMQDRKEV